MAGEFSHRVDRISLVKKGFYWGWGNTHSNRKWPSVEHQELEVWPPWKLIALKVFEGLLPLIYAWLVWIKTGGLGDPQEYLSQPALEALNLSNWPTGRVGAGMGEIACLYCKKRLWSGEWGRSQKLVIFIIYSQPLFSFCLSTWTCLTPSHPEVDNDHWDRCAN